MNKIIPGMCCILLLCSLATAEVMDLRSGVVGEQSLSVALTDFINRDSCFPEEESPDSVLAGDLAFSPRFRVYRMAEPDSQLFRDSTIPLYITGSYECRGDTIRMEAVLKDAVQNEDILRKAFVFTQEKSRRVGHHFADLMYERLFAEKGLFTSSILYCRSSREGKNVYAMDYDGHNSWAVTRSGVNIMPHGGGERSLYWINFSRGKADLYRGSLSRGDVRPLFASRRVESSPDYSVDADRLAFASSVQGSMDIFTITPQGKQLQRLSRSSAVDISPTWSPGGYRIAFISDRGGTPQVYVMNKDGRDVQRVTYSSTYCDSPDWAPSGEYIAYTSRREGRFDICVIRPDGTGERVLTSDLSGQSRYPAWSPDSRHIAFENEHGGKKDIYIIDLNTGDVMQVTTTGDAGMPSWTTTE
ncbi:MAG: hypothetical protein ACQEQV_07805 [Fibrobacterota bacterium]